MIFLTTTAIEIDEELLNRCLVLTVNEDREQTQAIHRKQREAQTLEGLLATAERDEVLKLHRNAQRLLEPIFVGQPLRRRADLPRQPDADPPRSHEVSDADSQPMALLHQHQRPRQDDQLARQAAGVHRGHAGRHRDGQPACARRCWAVRWTSCPRRRGACCC